MLFRDLTEDEKKKYRQWARDNYKVGEPIKGVYHPVVQAECVAMNAELSWKMKGNATEKDLFPKA